MRILHHLLRLVSVSLCLHLMACSGAPAVPPSTTATVTVPAPPPATATATVPATATIPPPPATATTVPELCRERPIATGKAPNTDERMPGGTRLRIARSDEMKVWTVDAGVFLDQAATPSLTLSPDGLPLVYMTAHAIDGKRDGFAVSVGDEGGTSWRHCFVNLTGFPRWMLGSDPDVVRIADQQYRIFLTGNLREGDKKIGIHYADSSDGITWHYGGIAFESAESVIDSMTFRLGDTWHMYVLPIDGIDMLHATSSDGQTFVQDSRAQRMIANKPHVLSQTLVDADAPDNAIIFGFGPPPASISMASTADGVTFTDMPANINPIISIGDGDALFVKDPAIVFMGRDSGLTQPYILVYATAIP